MLETRSTDLDRDFTDATDRLEAMANLWALDTASSLHIIATRADDPLRRDRLPSGAERNETAEAQALVARPGPLIAMKLKASVDRMEAKEATDLLDVIRLVTDPATSGLVTTEFLECHRQLAADTWQRAHLKYERQALGTLRIIRNLGLVRG